MDTKDYLNKRIDELQNAREQRLEELNKEAQKELLPFDSAIGELKTLLKLLEKEDG